MAASVNNSTGLSQAIGFRRAAAHSAFDTVALALFAEKLAMLAGGKEVNCLHLMLLNSLKVLACFKDLNSECTKSTKIQWGEFKFR